MKKIYTKLECEIILCSMDIVTASINADGPQGYDPENVLGGNAEEWEW